ncbi:glycerol-3-phosphate acyltransferase [Bacillus sp. 03113]|uniref:glycerol-3-phosphate acyltransferase n=1 Tax=Bacillus sp. 03113 TaxID=2578211 RepID=UPI00114391BE|nr:glycerol-3-phosphate acyltransferase [Bacillus sp. 03113]
MYHFFPISFRIHIYRGCATIIILYFLSSYLIGSLMTGFIVSKMYRNEDIRYQGSGNVGARNAGRIYGKMAFFITFMGDACKGALVVWLASYLHLSSELQLLCLLFAVIGHMKPITLIFKGGKGVSTFIGGALLFEPFLFFVILIGFLFTYLFSRSFTIAGLISLIITPIYIYLDHAPQFDWFVFLAIVFTILLAHSTKFRKEE